MSRKWPRIPRVNLKQPASWVGYPDAELAAYATAMKLTIDEARLRVQRQRELIKNRTYKRQRAA